MPYILQAGSGAVQIPANILDATAFYTSAPTSDTKVVGDQSQAERFESQEAAIHALPTFLEAIDAENRRLYTNRFPNRDPQTYKDVLFATGQTVSCVWVDK